MPRRGRASVNVRADVSELLKGLRLATSALDKLGPAAKDEAAAVRELERSLNRTSRASRNTGRASRDLGRQLFFLERRVASVSRNLNRVVAGLALGGGAFGATLTRLIDVGDRIVKTSDRLGLTTEELTAFRYAADLAGISTRNFDLGFQRFSRRLGEAIQGRGELAKPLEDLGIAIRNLDGSARSSLDVLKDFADALQPLVETGRISEALALTFKGFDTEGVAFIELLKGGSAELEKIPGLAQAAGVTLEREVLEPVVRLKDAFSEVRTAVTASLIRSLSDAAPELDKLVRRVGAQLPALAERAAAGFGVLARNLDLIIAGLVTITGARILLGLANLVRTFTALGVAISASKGGIVGAVAGVGLLVGGFALARREVDKFLEGIEGTDDALGGLGRSLGQQQRLNKLLADQEVARTELTDALAAQAAAQERVNFLQNFEGRLDPSRLRIAQAYLLEQNDARDAAKENLDTITAAIEELGGVSAQVDLVPVVAPIDTSGLTDEQQALLDGALTTKVAVELQPNFGGFNQIEARAVEAARTFQEAFATASSRFQTTGFIEGLDAGFDALTGSTRELVGSLSEVGEEAESSFSRVQQLGMAAFDSIAESASNFFANFIAGIDDAAEAFRRFVSDLLAQFAQFAIDQGFNAIRGSLFGGTGAGAAAAPAGGAQPIVVNVTNNYGTVDISGDVREQLDRQSERIAGQTIGALQRALGADTSIRRATRAAIA